MKTSLYQGYRIHTLSQIVLNFTNAIKIVYIMLRSDQKRYLCCHGDAINKV